MAKAKSKPKGKSKKGQKPLSENYAGDTSSRRVSKKKKGG